MSFNVGVFFTVIIGLSLGKTLTPWVPSQIDSGLENQVCLVKGKLYRPHFDHCCSSGVASLQINNS